LEGLRGARRAEGQEVLKDSNNLVEPVCAPLSWIRRIRRARRGNNNNTNNNNNNNNNKNNNNKNKNNNNNNNKAVAKLFELLRKCNGLKNWSL
jgi:hypothetical protein